MIIMPPDELLDYITNDEDGNLILTENTPDELLPLFEEFKKDADSAMNEKLAVFEEARREL